MNAITGRRSAAERAFRLPHQHSGKSNQATQRASGEVITHRPRPGASRATRASRLSRLEVPPALPWCDARERTGRSLPRVGHRPCLRAAGRQGARVSQALGTDRHRSSAGLCSVEQVARPVTPWSKGHPVDLHFPSLPPSPFPRFRLPATTACPPSFTCTC